MVVFESGEVVDVNGKSQDVEADKKSSSWVGECDVRLKPLVNRERQGSHAAAPRLRSLTSEVYTTHTI
jgi:hypothetical protein